MRKKSCIACALCLLALLSACSKGYISNKSRIIRDFKNNQSLFDSCVTEIEKQYNPEFEGSYAMKADQGCLAAKTFETVDAQWSTLEGTESSQLMDLFNTTKVDMIWIDNNSIYFREYSFGMGSTTSAGICYIPSDDIQDFPGYSSEMQFDAYEDGYLGTITGSDNYLYYQPLEANYFFYEYGD